MKGETRHYKVVIIGSGFGGTMTGLTLAEKFTGRGKGENILMLERGTWWTTPISTVQDKEVHTAEFLEKDHGQPVQFWTAQNHFRGFVDIFTRCLRRTKDVNIFTRLFKNLRNEDGLFEFTRLGTRGFLGLFGGKSDGVSVLRASGVGGGSLIYSNITIQPPDLIFDDERWGGAWRNKTVRQDYYERARHAISFGVVSASKATALNMIPFLHSATSGDKDAILKDAVNTGLSNIVMRTARLKPHWDVDTSDSNNVRGTKRIRINSDALMPDPRNPAEKIKVPIENQNRLWLDRARVFQIAMNELTTDYGAVDLAINDLTPENTPFGPNDAPGNYPPGDDDPASTLFGVKAKNYCDRQSRCNVGCLPGARHTLNKQLMTATLGKPDGTKPIFTNLKIEPLAEVDVIRSLPDGGYEVQFIQREKDDTSLFESRMVTADIVIVAAGCLGTNELMLRSKERPDALPNLSDKTGYGFSTNGDYLAFLEKTKDHSSIVRGPVTTSFGHFDTEKAGTGADGPNGMTAPNPKLFHTIEDQGMPPAFASLLGEGVPLIKSLGNGNDGELFLIPAVLRYFRKRTLQYVREIFSNNRRQAQIFRSEEELTSNMMCVVGMGRDDANAQFTLGKSGNETPLRVSKPGNANFWDDDIYGAIKRSLDRLAEKLRPENTAYEFFNPFLTKAADAARAKSIVLSHPLGGCRMANDVGGGVVDEFGRVFDKSRAGEKPVYEGLYIADASMIPTALGVNPSLTISALALRVADTIIADLESTISTPPPGPVI
jgi:choline dehydrogenase-like flavoprotein